MRFLRRSKGLIVKSLNKCTQKRFFRNYSLLFTVFCIVSMVFLPGVQTSSVSDAKNNIVNNSGYNLGYSTLLGGSSNDFSFYGSNIVVDAQGNSYVIGTTDSTDFPMINSYNSTLSGDTDAFVAKFNPSGYLIFSTYLGGSFNDYGLGIAVDTNYNIYVTGSTYSSNFPTKNAYNKTFGGNEDGFIAKFDLSGKLVFSSYLGGSGFDAIGSVVVDANQNTYVAGQTSSSNFPMKNSYNSTYGGNGDIFVAKFDPSGYLAYSTYLGGNSTDDSDSIAIDNSQNIYIAGMTNSPNFPMKNAYNSTYGGNGDVIISKFNSTGSLIFSTFFGGNQGDFSHGIAVDSNQNIYISGDTSSGNLPMKNSFNRTYGGNIDVFVAKISANNTLLFSTYLGGNNTDFGHGITIDTNDNIYVTGQTGSPNFPMKNAFNSTLGGNYDNFFIELSSSGSLVYGTIFGGNGYDEADGVAVDSLGNCYIAGVTASTDFPLNNSYRSTLTGPEAIFLIQFAPINEISISSNSSGSSSVSFSSSFPTTSGSSGSPQNSDILSNPLMEGVLGLFFLSLLSNLILLIRRK